MGDAMAEVTDRFGFFRVTDTLEEQEVRRAMDAVWGIEPRASDRDALPEIELIPRDEASRANRRQSEFIERETDFGTRESGEV